MAVGRVQGMFAGKVQGMRAGKVQVSHAVDSAREGTRVRLCCIPCLVFATSSGAASSTCIPGPPPRASFAVTLLSDPLLSDGASALPPRLPCLLTCWPPPQDLEAELAAIRAQGAADAQ